MSYDLANDGEQPEGPKLPGLSAVALRKIRNGSIVGVGLLFTFLILWWIRTVYTDLLWYGELGYRDVFNKILVMKVWLFIGGTTVASAALIINFYFTFRFSYGPSTLPVNEETMRLLRAILLAAIVVTVLTAAPVFGSAAAGRWEVFLLFFNKVTFGVSDAEFGRDVSFFIVTLQMLNFIQSWIMGLLICLLYTSPSPRD